MLTMPSVAAVALCGTTGTEHSELDAHGMPMFSRVNVYQPLTGAIFQSSLNEMLS